MASIDFSELFDTMKTDVVDLAKANLQEYVSQGTADGLSILNSIRSDIELWTSAIVRGEMDKDDLKFLIDGRRELTQMKMLQQAGIAQIQIEKFRNGLVDLIVGAITSLI